MNKCHTPITWHNDTTPAINETNLNYEDGCIDTIDDRVVAMDTSKANQSDLLKAFKDVSLNTTTGVITFTLFDNTTKTIDTLLEKVAINFDYDDNPSSAHYQNLIIELEDGTYKYIDMSALITEYEFTTSDTIAFTVGQDGAVSASVRDGSITGAKLQPNYLADVTAQANTASAAATAASGSASDAADSAEDSEAWAVGQRGGVDVDPTDPTYHNNAKYWKDQAQAIAGGTFEGLSDVNITSPTNGQVPAFNSTSGKWENADIDAEDVNYDNATSQLTANNVQDALDELTERIVVLEDYEKLDDVLGLEIDYDNNTFTRLAAARDLDAGDDFNQFSIYSGIRRCNLDSSGNVTYYKGTSGYDETALTLVEFQPYYYRFEPIETTKATKGFHVNKARYYISGTPHTGFKPMPWFVRNGQIDVAYYSAFNGSLHDVSESTDILDDAQVMDATVDTLCTRTGAKPASGVTQNLTKANLEKMANNIGSGYHLTTVQAEMAITWLMMIEYGVLDFQRTSLGRGVVSKASGSGNESEISGQAVVNANGSTYASDTTGLVPACWRWVENPYGNIWNNIQGINIFGDGTMLGGEPFICTDFNFDESKHTDNYVGAGFYIPNTGGYIKYFGYGNPDLDWLLLPSAIGGSNALPVGDYNWKTDNLNGLRIARLGANWNGGLQAGRSSWYFDDAVGDRYRHVGGRLEYRKGAI